MSTYVTTNGDPLDGWMPHPCADCGIELMPDSPPGSQDWERYMVHDKVWRAAGMKPNGGWLCIGCLETRLGRQLTGADFPVLAINLPGRDDDTPRLGMLKLNTAIECMKTAIRTGAKS